MGLSTSPYEALVAAKTDKSDSAPTTMISVTKINNSHQGRFRFKALFDSGSTNNIIDRRSLPGDFKAFKLATPSIMGTANGQAQCTEYCILYNIAFPELTYTQNCLEMIGRKFMSVAEFKLDFSANTVLWYDKSMSFHARSYFNNACLIEKCTTNKPFAVAEAYNIQSSCTAYVDSAAKYEETDLIKLANNQSHLSIETRNELQIMLLLLLLLLGELVGALVGTILLGRKLGRSNALGTKRLGLFPVSLLLGLLLVVGRILLLSLVLLLGLQRRRRRRRGWLFVYY